MRNLKRREFLGLAAGAAGVGLIYPISSWWRIGRSAANAGLAKQEAFASARGTLVITSRSALQLVDVAGNRAVRIELPNKMAHDTFFSPTNSEQGVAVDQNGDTSAVVDLKSRQIIHSLRAEPGMSFSGHGVFSPDGKWIYLPEFPADFSANGFVSVISTTSWKKEAKFSSGAAQTHEVVPLEEGRVLAVGHYGESAGDKPFRRGLLTFLDAHSGKTLETVSAPDEFHSLCHMDKTSTGQLVVATRSWQATGQRPDGSWIETHHSTPIAFGRRGGEWAYSSPGPVSDRLRLNLSVRVNEIKNRVLVTHLDGQLVTAWDLEGNYLGNTQVPGGPMGVSFTTDQKFALLNTRSGDLKILSPVTLGEIASVSLREMGLSIGAHSEFRRDQFIGA